MKTQSFYCIYMSFSYLFHIIFSRLHENDGDDWKRWRWLKTMEMIENDGDIENEGDDWNDGDDWKR